MYQEIVFCASCDMKRTMDSLHARGLRIIQVTPVQFEYVEGRSSHVLHNNDMLTASRFMFIAEKGETV